MDKGPHVIKLTPGGVPPIIHLSQYEGGDGTALRFADGQDIEFLLLSSDNRYYAFNAGKNNPQGGDLKKPAVLHYARPDGSKNSIALGLSRNNSVVGNSGSGGTTYSFTEPHIVAIRNIPAELTEVAGDVICEIQVLSDSDDNKIVERSENFILRVEPYPQSVATPTYGGGSWGGSSGGEDPSQLTRTQPTYFGSDAVDDTLVTWEEVVEAANNGTLDTLIESGQEIRAVMLTTGQFMGIRCLHVEDGRAAWFESKNLFLAPNEYSPGMGANYGYVAARSWAAGTGVSTEDVRGPLILPYEVRSAGRYFGSPACYCLFGPSSAQMYDYSDNLFGNDVQTYQFDYYKTASNRIKRIGTGETKPWLTGETDAKLINNNGRQTIETNYAYGVTLNGDLTRHPINDRPDEVFTPVCWRLEGKEEEAPIPVYPENVTWEEVKTAAGNGTLKELLYPGRLMPFLETLGDLRCIHVTDNGAVFSFAWMDATNTPSVTIAEYKTHGESFGEQMTDYEKTLFSADGNPVFFEDYGLFSEKNLGESRGYITGYTQYTMGTVVFDYMTNRSHRILSTRGGVYTGMGWLWSGYASSSKQYYSQVNNLGDVMTINTTDNPNDTAKGNYWFKIGTV